MHLKELQQIHPANGANNRQLLKLQPMQQQVTVGKQDRALQHAPGDQML